MISTVAWLHDLLPVKCTKEKCAKETRTHDEITTISIKTRVPQAEV